MNFFNIFFSQDVPLDTWNALLTTQPEMAHSKPEVLRKLEYKKVYTFLFFRQVFQQNYPKYLEFDVFVSWKCNVIFLHNYIVQVFHQGLDLTRHLFAWGGFFKRKIIKVYLCVPLLTRPKFQKCLFNFQISLGFHTRDTTEPPGWLFAARVQPGALNLRKNSKKRILFLSLDRTKVLKKVLFWTQLGIQSHSSQKFLAWIFSYQFLLVRHSDRNLYEHFVPSESWYWENGKYWHISTIKIKFL